MEQLPRDRRMPHLAAVASAGALILGACAPKPRLVQGECRTVNGAQVCTWARMSGNTLVAFGATIPVAAAQNAPTEQPMVWPPVADAVLAMPEEAQTATGFTFLNVFWEAHGHPPAPYLVPHFDFHFYTIASADVDAINCADSLKPTGLPATYELPDVPIPQLGTLVGLCVPKMGMHSLPGPELHATTPFEKTMIVGYYHRRPIFIEPMITQATLTARKSFLLAVPTVSGFPATVKLPTQFQAEYDTTANAYQFTFSGFAGAGKP